MHLPQHKCREIEEFLRYCVQGCDVYVSRDGSEVMFEAGGPCVTFPIRERAGENQARPSQSPPCMACGQPEDTHDAGECAR